MQIVGILLAAGRGVRFDPSGVQDKLMQMLPDGQRVAAASAQHLLQALPSVQAVVRPGAEQLQKVLADLGCRVVVCPDADAGMAASLVAALQATREADAWLIALADMPHVKVETLQALADALRLGASIVQPYRGGQGGNPVGFSRAHLAQLLTLQGDQGARSLLREHEVVKVAVEDDGIFHDIDTAADLPE